MRTLLLLVLLAASLSENTAAASAVSEAEDTLGLAVQRAARGQTPEGKPFYDDPSFERFCATARAAAPGSELTPAAVKQLHEGFVRAADGDEATLGGWLEVRAPPSPSLSR